jgi:peptidoglycan/xylan/chitin deacetylase (PgdA/CDA1 family)
LGLPSGVRRVAASQPFARLVDVLERLVPARTDTLAVLTFHRVTPDRPGVVPGLLSATPDGFAALIDAVARRHQIVGIDDVLRRARGGRRLRRRSVLLTVDDAYADFAEHAWPALRGRGLPVVLFVPTAYPDAPERAFWWERLFGAIRATNRSTIDGPDGPLPLTTDVEREAAYRRLRGALKAMPHEELVRCVDDLVAGLGGGAAGADAAAADGRVLGWDELRRLQSEGVSLAPHTRTHPLLPRLPGDASEAEIAGSREDLLRMTGSELPVFAYPSGATSPEATDAARRAGIEIAFTTERGVNDLRSAEWLGLRRINVSVRTPGALVRAQMLR